tara:strand:+ start:144 stop:545 length:402 start_codon:yes stop_codon:yes gene_type:complete
MRTRPANLYPLKVTVIVVIAIALGLQWGALQMVAWTGMILTNAQTMPLAVAVEKAVSAKEDCALCLFIAENRTNSAGEETVVLRSTFSLEAVSGIQDSLLDTPHFAFCFLHENFIIHNEDMQGPPRPPPETTV